MDRDVGARAGVSVVKAALGEAPGRVALAAGCRPSGACTEVRDNLWFIRIEAKEPYELRGEPFGPLGYILG
jgi:hypothetical protein